MRKPARHTWFAPWGHSAAVLLFLISVDVWAAQIPVGPPPPPPPPPESGMQDEVVKLGTTMVFVSFSATDQQGNPILDLTQGEVEIFEDNREQEISYFLPAPLNPQQDQPSLVMFLLDQSNTVGSFLRDTQAVGQFVMALPPSAIMAVASFGENLVLNQTFTADRELIERAFVRASGSVQRSNVFQAVVAAIDILNHVPPLIPNRPNRKILVVISDGLSSQRGIGAENAVNAANAAAVKIFALEVGSTLDAAVLPADLSNRYDTQEPGFGGAGGDDFDFGVTRGGTSGSDSFTHSSFSRGRFRQLAADSGGFYFNATRAANGISPFLRNVAQQIRSEYLIGYQPKAKRSDGKLRKIEVRIARKGVKAQGSRKGYLPVNQSKDQ